MQDMESAETAVLRYIQGQRLKQDIQALTKGEELSSSSPIARLDPRIDDKGIVRAGGRLDKCNAVAERHPIILSRYLTFVAHRIAFIHETSKPSQWNYVPTDKNPADLASRGVWPQERSKLKFWMEGPEFLQSNNDYHGLFESPKDEVELEIRVAATQAANQEQATDKLLKR